MEPIRGLNPSRLVVSNKSIFDDDDDDDVDADENEEEERPIIPKETPKKKTKLAVPPKRQYQNSQKRFAAKTAPRLSTGLRFNNSVGFKKKLGSRFDTSRGSSNDEVIKGSLLRITREHLQEVQQIFSLFSKGYDHWTKSGIGRYIDALIGLNIRRDKTLVIPSKVFSSIQPEKWDISPEVRRRLERIYAEALGANKSVPPSRRQLLPNQSEFSERPPRPSKRSKGKDGSGGGSTSSTTVGGGGGGGAGAGGDKRNVPPLTVSEFYAGPSRTVEDAGLDEDEDEEILASLPESEVLKNMDIFEDPEYDPDNFEDDEESEDEGGSEGEGENDGGPPPPSAPVDIPEFGDDDFGDFGFGTSGKIKKKSKQQKYGKFAMKPVHDDSSDDDDDSDREDSDFMDLKRHLGNHHAMWRKYTGAKASGRDSGSSSSANVARNRFWYGLARASLGNDPLLQERMKNYYTFGNILQTLEVLQNPTLTGNIDLTFKSEVLRGAEIIALACVTAEVVGQHLEGARPEQFYKDPTACGHFALLVSRVIILGETTTGVNHFANTQELVSNQYKAEILNICACELVTDKDTGEEYFKFSYLRKEQNQCILVNSSVQRRLAYSKSPFRIIDPAIEAVRQLNESRDTVSASKNDVASGRIYQRKDKGVAAFWGS